MARTLRKRPLGRTRLRAAVAPNVAGGSGGYGSGGPVWLDDFKSKRPPTPIELVNAYKAVAYACVRLNALGVARVPLRLYATKRPGQRPIGRGLVRISRAVPRQRELYLRRVQRSVVSPDVEVEEITEHPFLEALQRPCPFFDGPTFLQYLSTCLDVIGAAYFVPVRPDPSWASSEWWPLQAQYVMPVKGTGPTVLAHYTFFGQMLLPDDVVRLRNVSLRDPYLSQFSPVHACFEQLGLVNYYTTVLESILKSGGRPSGVLTPSDPTMPPGPDEQKRTERDVNRQFAGQRSGYIAVTSGAYKWIPFDYPPIDLGGLELTKNQRLVVANCLDVPISLLQTEDSNRAVAEAGNYQHQRNAVEPRCVTIAGGLTAMAKQVDDRLFFAFDNPVEADEERRARIVDLGLRNGTCTVNEARAENGQPPVEGGDEPLVSKGLVRLRDAAAEPVPATMPTEGGDAAPTSDTVPTEDVQATALNGAQVASLLEIVAQVTAGQLDPTSAKAVLKAAFPAFTDEQVNTIIDKAVAFEPERPPTPEAPGGPPDNAGGEDGENADPERDGPPTGNGGGGGKPRAEDDERALIRRLHRYLDRLDATDDARGNHPGDHPDAAARPAGRRGRGEEHLWAADRGADPEGAAEVVPEATGGDSGDGLDDRSGADGGVSPAGGLRRPDGLGDDADPDGLLGRGGAEDAGAAGPGPGRLAGVRPAPAGEDPAGGPELLPGDERDDQ